MKQIILLTLILITVKAHSQRSVHGKVFDKNRKDIFIATIEEDSTKNITKTDIFDGTFSFRTLKDSCEIKIKSDLYKTLKIKITQDTTLEIALDCASPWGLGEASNAPAINEYVKKWLESIGENFLDTIPIDSNFQTIRVIWFRTFCNPILFKLNKKKNNYTLSYVIGEGRAGYNPCGVKIKKEKTITIHEWNYYNVLLEKTGFDSIPNSFALPMCDGTSWYFERKNAVNYKAHYTNVPSESQKTCGYYLLAISGIDLGKYTLCNDYTENYIYLDKRNEIISKKAINDSLIAHLNNKLSVAPPQKNDWYYLPEKFIIVNSKGKVIKIKTPIAHENSFLSKIQEYIDDRKGRKLYRKALKDINLSNFNFKSKMKIYFYSEYDEKTNKLK